MEFIIYEKSDLDAQATNFVSDGIEAKWKSKQFEKIFNKVFF